MLRGMVVRAAAGLLLCMAFFPTPAGAASEAEMSFLAMYFTPEELEVFSVTRSLKSVASVAENVAIVTAEDIEAMNAHTVAEALYNETGIEMAAFKGPGSGGYASIHGAGQNRVAVMIDGVPMTTANNDYHLSAIPVQMIEKIEIVKGPASATWGSSFGGLINVITKAPPSANRIEGMASASYGEANTYDTRAELAGRKGTVGFYLTGGRMDSDGVQEGHEFTHGNFFSKLRLKPGRATEVDLSLYSEESDTVSADFVLPTFYVSEGFKLDTLLGKADLRTALSSTVDLSLTGWWSRQDDVLWLKGLSTGEYWRYAPTRYDRQGVSGNLEWRAGAHAVVAGAEYSDGRFEHRFEPALVIDQQKYALFANDTYSSGAFCVTPGLRYDHSSLAGGLASPSLGATYLASKDLLVRAIVSRGFHDPMIVRYFDAPALNYQGNRDLKPEKVWSYQAGLEANLANRLRTKLTLFYHDIDDILVVQVLDEATRTTTMVNGGHAKSYGGEFEAATNTYRGFSFKAGGHYEHIKRLDYSDPQYFDTMDVYGLNATLAYSGNAGLRGVVKAHYLRWDLPASWGAEPDGIVVDATIDKKFQVSGKLAIAPFFSAHNIFNAANYNDQFHQNPDRWLEAGVRCSF